MRKIRSSQQLNSRDKQYILKGTKEVSRSLFKLHNKEKKENGLCMHSEKCNTYVQKSNAYLSVNYSTNRHY